MLYIFDKDDNFKNIITEDTGLIDTWFKDYQNHLIDGPFKFHVDPESDLLPLLKEENQVAFYDRANRLRMMRLKETFEIFRDGEYVVEVMAEPSWLELYDHFIEDRRVVDGEAQIALNRTLEGSRYTGEVQVKLGLNTTNFYWIDAVEAIFKIIDTWGGSLVDTIEIDENNEIIERKILIVERLGADNGLLIQPDYNAEMIERRTLSYPKTAMWGQGASLEIEDEEGNATGGHTRYITFEDVEWKKSKGDPVDKPLGQKWVGDPDALVKYGDLLDDGTRKHREGHFSNQDYETPEDLLWGTWQALQKQKELEVYHEAVIDEVDRDVFLGDTGTILDRHYGKPIEVQSQITGIEYDILEPNENVKVVLGNYKDMSRDPLEDEIDDIKKEQSRPPIIGSGNFPNKKPMKPENVEGIGGWETIQLTWTYTNELYVSHYEVYASQTQGFVPDKQYLVYNGKVSAFGHEVKTDEVWYYRVCAVNYHDVRSDYSDEAMGMTIRIPLEVTEFENIVNDAKDTADEAYENANIATGNATAAINKAQEGFDKALESLGKADESFNLAQDSFSKSIENATEINDLALRFVGTNRITHDADMWEQGYVSTNTGNNNVSGNPGYIRADGYYDLEPDTMYTLTTYGDYRATIFYYDENKNYLNEYDIVLSDSYRTFKTPINARFLRIGIDGLGNNINPSMMANEIKIKLEKGDKSTEWTMHDPDYTNLVINQKGLQLQIGNVEGNVTDIKAIAEGLQLKMDDTEGDIFRLQATAQGLSGSIESVNTRLDELDGDDRNLITHLSANWGQGYISTNTGNNNISGNPQYIRRLGFFDIQANEVYTLATYGEYRATLYFYDNTVGYLNDYEFVLSNETKTFTTPPNVTRARIAIDGLGNDISPNMLGADIKIKLAKNDKESDWTPNLNDTGELVNNVQTFVHDFNVTAEGLASRISDNQGNINQIANTVDGWQQTVSNLQGDVNIVTNIAEASQRQLSNLEGDVNTLTSTANSLVSRLDNSGGRNLIEYSRGDSLEGWQRWGQNTIEIAENYLGHDWIWIRRTEENNQVGINTPVFDLKANKKYIISFLIRSRSNVGYILNYIYLRQGASTIYSIKKLPNVNMGDAKFEGDIAGDGLRVWFTFSHDADIQDARILLAASDRPDDAGFLLREVQVEQSEIVNDWQPAPEDAYSQFSQLQREMNFRIKEGDLLTQINLEADRLLIDTTGKLILSAESTLIENAIIKDAHITNLSGEKLLSKSVIADKLDVTKLSAIAGDLGLMTAGQLKSQNDRVFFDLNQGQLNINNGAINITRPDGAIWVEDGVPKFNYNVQTEFFLDENVNWTGRWFETGNRGSQRYKIASFKHEGRFLKMNVITNLSWKSPSQGEFMYFGVIPLNGKVITVNHIQRVNVQNNESASHVLTIDMGKPTYQEVSIYLVLYKERLDNGGSHNDNIVQVRTNRIWQEG